MNSEVLGSMVSCLKNIQRCHMIWSKYSKLKDIYPGQKCIPNDIPTDINNYLLLFSKLCVRLVKCSHVFKLFICWITEVHETVEQNSLSFSLIRLLGLFKQKHWWLKSNKSCFNRFVNCITFLYDYFCMYRYCSTVTMVLTAIPLNHPALTTCNRWDWYSLII